MQPIDPSGRYGAAAVAAALQGARGARTMSYRYDLLDVNNNLLGPIDYVTACTVSNNYLADIKRTAKISLLDYNPINFLSNRIKPWARLTMPDGGYVEWPLGVFLLATPSRSTDATNTVSRDVDAYDQLLVLNQDKTTDRYSVAAGTKYTDAVIALAVSAGIVWISVVPSGATLPVAKDYDPGTTKLSIINDLLGTINYDSVAFDENGVMVAGPYLLPAGRSAGFTYAAGTTSVVSGVAAQTLDLFDVPNRWVRVKSEADQTALTSSYTNTNPSSPTSTVSRGRTIVDFATETDAPDQATLDALTQRAASDASQVFESIDITTPVMPFHSNNDIVHLTLPGLAVDTNYAEQSWEMPLVTGGVMKHTIRRVVSV